MELDELARLIKNRRSIRVWQDKAVPADLLVKAVELATWAPNGGNQQNWRFYVIVKRDTIKAIADAVQTSSDAVMSWPETREFPDLTARLKDRPVFFRSAPAAIAVAAAQYQSPIDQVLVMRGKADPAARQIRQWRNIADSRIQSVASATAHLLLVLHQMGLGAVWMTGPIQAKGEIEKILKVPPQLDIVTFIPVGYPAESPEPKVRRPLSEVCEVIR